MNPAAHFGGGRGYRAGQITRKVQVGISVYYAGVIICGSIAAGVIWCAQNPLPGIPILFGIVWIVCHAWKPQIHRIRSVASAAVKVAPPTDPVIAQLIARGHSDKEAHTIAKHCPWLYNLDEDQRTQI